jgi:hypothetical protein
LLENVENSRDIHSLHQMGVLYADIKINDPLNVRIAAPSEREDRFARRRTRGQRGRARMPHPVRDTSPVHLLSGRRGKMMPAS